MVSWRRIGMSSGPFDLMIGLTVVVSGSANVPDWIVYHADWVIYEYNTFRGERGDFWM